MTRDALVRAKKLVVKLGTGVLAPGGKFDAARFDALADDLAAAAKERELTIVSSGAIALGVERLGLATRPRDIPGKQACAAVGQSLLMRRYEDALGKRGLTVAQVLLTHADIANRTRYLNARHALAALHASRAVPVINENDTVSVEEIRFGDNDALAGMVVDVVGAEALVLLTDIDGLFTADPRTDPTATLVPELARVTPEVERLAGGAKSGVGTGGMASKLKAARRAAEAGAACVIANGTRPGALRAVLSGESVGTYVHAAPRSRGRKRWLASDLRARGSLTVDAGARDAIERSGKSLLPSGVREVSGAFAAGEPVEIRDAAGPFARGLAGYSSDEIRRILGKKTSEIEQTLGYKVVDEVVHRDDLALLGKS